jgi:hypothetical protein
MRIKAVADLRLMVPYAEGRFGVPERICKTAKTSLKPLLKDITVWRYLKKNSALSQM